MELQFKACDEKDRGTQKCRLSPEEMDTRGIHIGSCISVQTPNRSYVCSAWPRDDGFRKLMQFDPICCLEEIDYSATTEQGSYTVESLQSKKITSFSVDVVFANVQDVKKYRHCLAERKDPITLGSLKKNILNILHGLYVGENMCVDCATLRIAKLYGISHLRITEASSSDPNIKYGLVSSSTKVQVRDVVSLEKFSLQTGVRKRLVCGGCDFQIRLLTEFFQLPTDHAKAARELGVDWPHGLLIQGPSGTGKSTLVSKVAQDLDLIVLKTDGSKVFGSRAGEGEEKIRRLFKKAADLSEEAPCVVLIEDVDAMCPGRSGSGSGRGTQEKRMILQLAACMDQLTSQVKVLVVGTTCHPQRVDSVLRRPGRFEKEILLGVPTMAQRSQILELLTKDKPCGPCVDMVQLSEFTPGFVAADLKALVNQAHYLAATSTETTEFIKMEHFQKALHEIVPSTQRGSDVLVDHRPVSWADVGGLHDVKAQLKQAVEWPLKHGAAFARLGIRPPSGVLLYGPPGCAKTLLVRAAASACGATFLAISGAQLHSPFVGDAEKKLSEVFHQARAGAPSILFLDEVDAMLGKRKEGGKSGGSHERVLSMLLNELDGIGVRTQNLVRNKDTVMVAEGDTSVQSSVETQETTSVDNSGVLVVAATNRPDMVDDALKRPGRLDKVIYVPPPDLEARLEILKVHTKHTPLNDVNLESVAKGTQGFSGADLENLCREAALHALTVDGLETACVSQRHLDAMLQTLKPSLTKEQLKQYEQYYQIPKPQPPKGFDFSKASPLKTDFDFSVLKSP